MPIQMDRKRKKRCAAALIWVGRASDKAAAATGMSRRTLEKAQAIIDAAEADPEKFGSDTRICDTKWHCLYSHLQPWHYLALLLLWG